MTQGLIKLLKEADIVVKKDVALRGGQQSDIYFDVKKSYGVPNVLRSLGEAILETMDKDITCVVGKGYGGIPLAVAVSLIGEIPLVTVRDNVKDHGLGKCIECYVPTEKDIIVIVDDVITSGSSILETAGIVSSTGVEIRSAYVVIKREDVKMQFPVHYLVDSKDLL